MNRRRIEVGVGPFSFRADPRRGVALSQGTQPAVIDAADDPVAVVEHLVRRLDDVAVERIAASVAAR